MVFEIHIPVYPLNLFIESFIYYRDYQTEHRLDRLLPDGNITVIMELTGIAQHIYDNHTLQEIQACRRVWFSGIRTKYITIPSTKESEMFIINFHKGKTYPFVQMPLTELTDTVVDGETVLTPEILNIREQLAELPTIQQKFLYAETRLLQLFGNRLVSNPAIDYAVNTLMQSPHIITTQQVADKTGYSQKHFIKLFKDNVGLTPKAFMRVTRFQKAIAEIEQTPGINWAAIADECGYFDQAHFINDFKNFSGFTPQQYLVRKNSQVNYVPVG